MKGVAVLILRTHDVQIKLLFRRVAGGGAAALAWTYFWVFFYCFFFFFYDIVSISPIYMQWIGPVSTIWKAFSTKIFCMLRANMVATLRLVYSQVSLPLWQISGYAPTALTDPSRGATKIPE